MALSVDFFESLNDSYPIDLSQFTSMCSSSAPELTTSLKNTMLTLPTDLRIGSKVRVTCNHSFPWLKNESATGAHNIPIPPDETSMGMRLSMNGYAENAQMAPVMSLARTPLAILQAASMFYQSSGPSAKPLFPRLEGTFSNKKASKTANENSLMSEWAESFMHLYRTWLTGERQYFYACAYSFTALFIRALRVDTSIEKSAGKKDVRPAPSSSSSLTDFDAIFYKPEDREKDSSSSETENGEQPPHRIVITPTSLGFREMLTAEGIKFTLPLRNSNKSFIDYALEKGDKDFLPAAKRMDGETALEDGDDLDEDEWLKDIGISPKSTIKFRKTHSFVDFSASTFEDLEAEEVKPLSASILDSNINPMSSVNGSRKRKVARLTSSQPLAANQEDVSRSTVVIAEPDSMDAFYRLLLFHQAGVSKNGLHAGLPPTLVAPSPFLGAIPRKLKMSSQVTNKANELKYVLELDDGPIMPFVAKLLTDFLTTVFSHETAANDGDSKISKKPRPKKGTAHVQILGQLPYAGLNEAMRTSAAANINEFHFDLASQSFSF